MLRIGIIVGSTRQGRKGDKVAGWLHGLATARGGVDYRLLDLIDFRLPLLGEADEGGAVAGWQDAVAGCDGFIVVAAEYNHAPGAALKNALDLCGPEWKDKAVAFAGYGGNGAARSVEILRLVTAALGLAGIKSQLGFSFAGDFTDDQFSPRPHHERMAADMLADLESWTRALRDVRQGAVRAAA